MTPTDPSRTDEARSGPARSGPAGPGSAGSGPAESGPLVRPWLPPLAGIVAELFVLALAVAVPLPPPIAGLAALATLGIGLLGGYVTGRLSDDGPTGRRNGVVVGLAGGVAAAVLVRSTMALAIPRARWSAVWTLEYWFARGLGGLLPADVAARYDWAIATGLAVVVGALVFAGAAAAATAASPLSIEPPDG